jgi:glycine/D-amino acid oxidase-like deaminating enzyme
MSYGPNELYTRSSLDSLGQWKRLFARVGKPELFRETGMLWLAPEGDELARQSHEVLARVGVRHEVLGHDELARRFPQIAVVDGGWAVYEPGSGALLARRAVQAVVADAVRAGVELRAEQVLPPSGDGRIASLRTASGASLSAGRYVFACGPWLGKVFPEALATRIFPTRQEVYYFGAPAGDARYAPPALPAWLDFSRSWYGIPDLESRGFKLALDTHGDAIDPDAADRTPTASLIDEARAFLARRFPGMARAPLVGAEVCQYENTSNGDFLLDRHPSLENAWLAGGGSGHGFKHGPAVGAYVARHLMHGAGWEPRYGYASKREVQRREVL